MTVMALDHPILSTFSTIATVASPIASTTIITNIFSNAAVASTNTIIPSPTPTYTSSPGGIGNPDSHGNGECRLLGPFSLLVQAALGGLALLSLVYKRWRERPQRPIKIWAFDASKQVFGSCMLHLLNLLLSMFSAGHFEIKPEYQPNPCSFYLLNLGIDTTLGIPILVFCLRLIHRLALYTPLANPPVSIESGNYGHPPRAGWWLKQSMLYFIGLLWMKICVFLIIQIFPFIVKVGDWALRWTEGNTLLQIVFVMLLFPLIMNAIQYYIIDTFIKKPITSDDDDDRAISEECQEDMLDEDNHPRGPLLAHMSDDDLSDPESDDKSQISVRLSPPITGDNGSLSSTDYEPAGDDDEASTKPSPSGSIR